MSHSTPTPNPALQQWLEGFLRRHDAIAGSVHLRVRDALEIVAWVGLPTPVVEVTARIPHGKGMAGIAWATGRPVDTCNLKTDETGRVRPGARAVSAHAAVALPVAPPEVDVASTPTALLGVVGLAFSDERALPHDQLDRLMAESFDTLNGDLAT
ncbi:MAG: GAF domain-containing protein [Bradymonadia bacterium]